MTDNSHESFETHPKLAHQSLQEAEFVSDSGEIDKEKFVAAAELWTNEQEAPYETWNDDELLQMVIRMDPRDPKEFELQQELMAIWRNRVKDRHDEL